MKKIIISLILLLLTPINVYATSNQSSINKVEPNYNTEVNKLTNNEDVQKKETQQTEKSEKQKKIQKLTKLQKWEKLHQGLRIQQGVYLDVPYWILEVNLRSSFVTMRSILPKETEIDEETGVENYKYETLYKMARHNLCTVAINGGFFNPSKPADQFEDTVIYQGKIYSENEERSVFTVNQKGTEANIGVYRKPQIISNSHYAIGGGPIIIWDGIYDFDPFNEQFSAGFKNHIQYTKDAHTAIGINNNKNKVYMLVTKGDNNKDYGLVASEIATLLIDEYDVHKAMFLDGGGSSQMYVKGEIINVNKTQRKIINGIGVITN